MMKRQALLLGLLLLAGCTGGQPDPLAPGGLETVELTCALSGFTPTRAALDGVQGEWSEGDVILVEAGGATYPFTTAESGPEALFKGQLPAGTGRVRARFEAGIPAAQTGDPAGYIPYAAEGDLDVSRSLDFAPDAALVRIRIDRDDIRFIQAAGPSDIADGSRAVRCLPPAGGFFGQGYVFLVLRPVEGEELSLLASGDRGDYRLTLSGLRTGDFRVVTEAVSDWQNDAAVGPQQFIFIQSADWQYNSSLIAEHFGPWDGLSRLAVGEAAMFYLFERPVGTLDSELRSHLAEALRTGVPVLVELDPITFWDDVPELWNWFDPSLDGYDPANRENVEWTSWSPDDAVKIGWLNWGRQIRLKPMANLFSPACQAAVRARMGKLLTTVSDWYKGLPADKKYLLAGIKIIGEFAFGVNNWYYPDGNRYYGQDEAGDPKTGITSSKDPSWGAQQMGYAALTYSGLKTSGTITAADIVALEKAYVDWLAAVVAEYGFPRELLFAHAGCWNEHLSSCIHERVCPSWSWYSSRSIATDTYIMGLIRDSSAPWWGVAEWAVGSGSSGLYKRCLGEILALDGCRFISVFENVVGDYNASGAAPNQAAVTAIRALIEESR